MTDKVWVLVKEHDMLPPGVTVLCAVSGGADSMCLLHWLESVSAQKGFSLHCAHFNHCLRPVEADRDEDFVRTWCCEHQIPFTSGRGNVKAESVRTGRGIEETARNMRYAFLERTALEVGAARIATAHTADDNAETVLLHLVRGSGLQGLCGIHPRRGMVVRPLLNVTRAQVEEYCALHQVSFVEDATNADETYVRNFVRRQVIPLLRQVNPRAVEHISAASKKVRVDHSYLTELAQEVADGADLTPGGLVMKAGTLADLPDAVGTRVVRLLLERAGGAANCAQTHVDAVMGLCRSADPSAQADLPGVTARRVYDELILSKAEKPHEPPGVTAVDVDGKTAYGETGWFVVCRKVGCPEEQDRPPGAVYLSCGRIKGAMVLRARSAGDALKLPARSGKSLKKWFIEEKIPLLERDLIPVLADDAGVLAVALLGGDVSRLAAPGEEAFEIIFEKSEQDGILRTGN